MADHGDGLVRAGGVAHQLLGHLVGADGVGIHHPAGQQQGVVVVHAGAVEGAVDLEFVGRCGVVPAAHLARSGRNEFGPGAGFFQGFPGAGHLDLLEAIGQQDCHALAL